MKLYTVRIHQTDYQFQVAEKETILQAALRQDIPLPWGCNMGVCGVCLGTVLEGQLEYLVSSRSPLALFEEDAVTGKALFCCAYASSDLLIAVPELVERS